MSNKAVAWALDQRVGNSHAKLVLIALADSAQERGESFPSMARIATVTEQHEDTIRKALAYLVDNGIIEDTGGTCGETGRVRVYLLPEGARCERKTIKSNPPIRRVIQDDLIPGESPENPRRIPGESPHPPVPAYSSNLELRTKNNEASPSMKEFVDLWCQRFSSAKGRKYVFNGVVDATAAKRLLASGLTNEEIVSCAEKAWLAPQEKWHCWNRSSTIAKFSGALNEIQEELTRKQFPSASLKDQRTAVDELIAAHPCNKLGPRYDPDANQAQREEFKKLKERLLAIRQQVANV